MLVEQPNFGALRAAKRLAGFRTPPASPAVRKQRNGALELAETERLNRGAYAFRVVPVDSIKNGVFHLGGVTFDAPKMVPEHGEIKALAVGVATVGRRLEERVQSLFAERKAGLALGLDNLGTEMLFATSSGLEARLRAAARREGYMVSGELRPGDPGLELEAQEPLLQLLAPERVNIALSDGLLLEPMKSTSVIYGIGINLPEKAYLRCADCKSKGKCLHLRMMMGEET
jgi:hypothetical protein